MLKINSYFNKIERKVCVACVFRCVHLCACVLRRARVRGVHGVYVCVGQNYNLIIFKNIFSYKCGRVASVEWRVNPLFLCCGVVVLLCVVLCLCCACSCCSCCLVQHTHGPTKSDNDNDTHHFTSQLALSVLRALTCPGELLAS